VAFVRAANAHTEGYAQCAAIVSPAASACDSQRNTVRAWDFVAAGAWMAAAATGTIAVVLWLRPSSPPPPTAARILVGPASLGLHGDFE
jgi:hypothetical protein